MATDNSDISINVASENEKTERTLYRQESFDRDHFYSVPPKKSFKDILLEKHEAFSCKSFIFNIFPILSWIQEYKIIRDIPHDIVSGLTVGVMHLPQGLAYAMLALVPPITGLYMAFFPVLIYMIMGTSRHVSMGTLSIVCIMTSNAVLKYSKVGNNDSELESYQVAAAVCLIVGIVQLIMGICQMGVVKILLSESLMNGFSTAAAIHVLVSQLSNLTGIKTSPHNGMFKIINMISDLCVNYETCNYISLGISALVIITLIIFTFSIKPLLEKKCSYPFPIELIYILIGTIFSEQMDLNETYNVKTVGEIPLGLPSPEVPPIWLIPNLITDGISIAIVAYSINLSMASIMAKKGNYSIQANQELIASGCGNIFASFFSCVPFAASLSRSLIQQSVGGKTQIASLISCIFLLLVLLVVGPFFEPLPTCVLAGIVVVALKSMFVQFKDLKKFWNRSKLDGIVWIVGFSASVLLDIDIGLAIGIFVSITLVLFYSQQIILHILGQVPGTTIYLDTKRYGAAKLIPGIKIIQVTGGLNFANKESFQRKMSKLLGLSSNYITNYVEEDEDICLTQQQTQNTKSIILDFYGISYIDPSAGDVIQSLQIDLKEKLSCSLYITNCQGKILESLKHYFDNKNLPLVFPSIHDAVQHAVNME